MYVFQHRYTNPNDILFSETFEDDETWETEEEARAGYEAIVVSQKAVASEYGWYCRLVHNDVILLENDFPYAPK